MKIVARVLLLILISTLLSACEKWSWPPYEKSLRAFFAENRERFEDIRQNMLADSLELVDSAHARGRAYGCAGAGCPSSIDAQDEGLQAKYSELIEERSVFQYTLRDGDFNVGGLPFPPTRSGRFYFDYVWSEEEASIPHCDAEKARLPNCGACYKTLDPNWYMHWRWVPDDLGPDWDGSVGDGLPSPEEIQEQYEEALIECLRKGWEEMGLDSGADYAF